MVLVVDVQIGCSCAFLPDGGPGYFPSPLLKDSKNIRALVGQLVWSLPLRLYSLTQFLFISRSNIRGSFIHFTPVPSLGWEHLLLVFRSFLISLNLAHKVLAFSFPDVFTLAPRLLFAINSISVKIENRPQGIRACYYSQHIKQQAHWHGSTGFPVSKSHRASWWVQARAMSLVSCDMRGTQGTRAQHLL